jgi:hypothetical protein
MHGIKWVALAVASLGCAPRPESADEAMVRLIEAYDGVRDAHVKTRWSMTLSTPGAPSAGGGTEETWYRWDGDVCLLRNESGNVQRVSMGESKVELTFTALVVIDDQYAWTSGNHTLLGPFAFKSKRSDAPSLVGDSESLGLIFGLHRHLRTRYRETAAKADIRVVGKGQWNGRATTIIETALRAEALAKRPRDERSDTPVRSVIEFDDGAGIPLVVVAYTVKGEEVLSIRAVELETNVGLSRDLFKFVPPEGVISQGAWHVEKL